MRTRLCSSSNRQSASDFASSVLPTPVGPRNRKLPMGRFGSAMPARRALDGLGHQAHGLVLSDHALVEDLVQVQQLLALALHQLRLTGMPVQLADDLGDLLLGHGVAHAWSSRRCASRLQLSASSSCFCSCGQIGILAASAAFSVLVVRAVPARCRRASARSRSCSFLTLSDRRSSPLSQRAFMALNCSFSSASSFCQLPPDGRWESWSSSFLRAISSISCCMILRRRSSSSRGHGVDLGADHGAGLIHQVDGLVGQETVGDIAVADSVAAATSALSWMRTPW